jgi:hypothetical protein
MPIENYTWTNCRKCGHRYAKHIPKCPRCNEKTNQITGKAIAVVLAGILAVGILYALTNGIFTNSSQSNLRNVGEQISSAIPKVGAREPIATWDNCYSNIAGEVDTKCYQKGEGPYGSTSSIVKTFRFKSPQALEKVIAVATKTTVYQYGSNDFEIALFDQVGEKRYQTSLWELPQ